MTPLMKTERRNKKRRTKSHYERLAKEADSALHVANRRFSREVSLLLIENIFSLLNDSNNKKDVHRSTTFSFRLIIQDVPVRTR